MPPLLIALLAVVSGRMDRQQLLFIESPQADDEGSAPPKLNDMKTALPTAHHDAPCPCGGSATYAECCGRWHAGTPAPDAEKLMRSRYTAYVLARSEYLLATWHVTTRPSVLEVDSTVKWLGLDVRKHLADGNRAVVEFVARSKQAGRATRLHETSRFVRESGRWYYVGGDVQ